VSACMPCSFGLLPHPRSEAGTQSTGVPEVTVTIRCIPLVPAAYGTWVARPARTTMLAPGGNGSQLAQRVRSVLGDHRLVGKSPEGSRQPSRDSFQTLRDSGTLPRLFHCLMSDAATPTWFKSSCVRSYLLAGW
jgi:hypothetical protein